MGQQPGDEDGTGEDPGPGPGWARRDPRLAGFSMVALVVDRTGNCLAGRVPDGGDATDIEVVRGEPPAGDGIAVLLHDVLLAQYEWTSAVFGAVP